MFTTYPNEADLAANLTDLALEIHAGAGKKGDSVRAELELWHTLQAELAREQRLQRPIDQHELAQRAAWRVARGRPLAVAI